ncbi:hypothetical protein P3K38_00535 [Staphylococcus pseudintermedius]|uniref:hypothetical protein n=1 Tax=Staphylococcus pseudintermedius TaxID=283734 RepID=UPI0038577732
MEGQIIPGVGTKYSLTTANNDIVHVILHYNGKREIYITDEDEDVLANIGLNETEAREIALKLMDVITIQWKSKLSSAFHYYVNKCL